jgi:hypothetical protein
MSTSFLGLPLLLLFAGSATLRADTAIDKVVQALERKEAEALAKGQYEEFPYRSCSGINLPSNAPPQEVVAEAIRQDGWTTNGITVVTTRTVHIRPPHGLDAIMHPADLPALLDRRAHTALTAVLLKTPVGERVVLMEFLPPAGSTKRGFNSGFWVQETYDPERMLNEQGGANGRQPIQSETNRTSAAATSRRSP